MAPVAMTDAGDPEGMFRYVETTVSIDDANGEFRWFRAVLRYQTDRRKEACQDIGLHRRFPHASFPLNIRKNRKT